MSPQRELFASFLAELGLSDPAGLLSRFELYHSLLLELNVRVNLFSRGTAAEDLWSKHFLDSLLPLKSFDFLISVPAEAFPAYRLSWRFLPVA